MNRRAFIASLAGLPLVSAFGAKAKAEPRFEKVNMADLFEGTEWTCRRGDGKTIRYGLSGPVWSF